MANGLFLVLEGGEGAGKSTLARWLEERVSAAGRECLVTREPGGTALGEAIRGLLEGHLAPWAEAFCFLAARAQLVAEVVRPALDRGQVVICDRYSASTLAYQGYGRGLDLTRLRAANTIATDGLQADLTILLDLDPEVGLVRKAGEAAVVRTGAESRAFHDAVRAGYVALAAEARPGTWVTLDASQPSEWVRNGAWQVVEARLKRRRFDR